MTAISSPPLHSARRQGIGSDFITSFVQGIDNFVSGEGGAPYLLWIPELEAVFDHIWYFFSQIGLPMTRRGPRSLGGAPLLYPMGPHQGLQGPPLTRAGSPSVLSQ